MSYLPASFLIWPSAAKAVEMGVVGDRLLAEAFCRRFLGGLSRLGVLVPKEIWQTVGGVRHTCHMI
jgi:hypothetical protein